MVLNTTHKRTISHRKHKMENIQHHDIPPPLKIIGNRRGSSDTYSGLQSRVRSEHMKLQIDCSYHAGSTRESGDEPSLQMDFDLCSQKDKEAVTGDDSKQQLWSQYNIHNEPVIKHQIDYARSVAINSANTVRTPKVDDHCGYYEKNWNRGTQSNVFLPSCTPKIDSFAIGQFEHTPSMLNSGSCPSAFSYPGKEINDLYQGNANYLLSGDKRRKQPFSKDDSLQEKRTFHTGYDVPRTEDERRIKFDSLMTTFQENIERNLTLRFLDTHGVHTSGQSELYRPPTDVSSYCIMRKSTPITSYHTSHMFELESSTSLQDSYKSVGHPCLKCSSGIQGFLSEVKQDNCEMKKIRSVVNEEEEEHTLCPLSRYDQCRSVLQSVPDKYGHRSEFSWMPGSPILQQSRLIKYPSEGNINYYKPQIDLQPRRLLHRASSHNCTGMGREWYDHFPASEDDGSSTETSNEALSPTAMEPKKPRKYNCFHLWEFFRDTLNNEEMNPKCMEWTDKSTGEFRLIDPTQVSILWGRRKTRKSKAVMNYNKMARAMRFYYKKKILEKVVDKKLHYRFCKEYIDRVITNDSKVGQDNQTS